MDERAHRFRREILAKGQQKMKFTGQECGHKDVLDNSAGPRGLDFQVDAAYEK